MAPGIEHCVYTIEDSLCTGAHGWRLEDTSLTLAALRAESINNTHNEVLPLWYPTLLVLADMRCSPDQLKAIRDCLESPFFDFTGKTLTNVGVYDEKGTVLDYSTKEIARMLLFCRERAIQTRAALLHGTKRS
jgi:hypothetical protein